MQQTKLTRAYGSRPLLRPAVQRVPRLAVSASAAVNPSVVVFKMQHHVNYGDSMHLTGSHEAIGSWDPKAALAMSWTEGDVWVAEAKVPVGVKLEYKFIVKNGATVTWQQGANKSVVVPESAKVEVTDTWREGPTNFKVVEAAMAALAAPAAAASAPSTPATAPKTPINVPSAITPSLAAKIEAAQSVARSFDQDKSADHRPVSTVENLEAEVETVPEQVPAPKPQPVVANNIVTGVPAGAVSVTADAQVEYEEADKFQVMEVSTKSGNAKTTVRAGKKAGPNALDHLTVGELRSELKKRGLPSNGNRRQLINKLQESGAI